MKRKLKIKNETLEFKMTNKTIFDIDEKFENFGEVINGVMYGKNLYNNSLKVLACSCITRELTVKELMDNLDPTQITTEIVNLATMLYFDYMGVKPQENNSDLTNSQENKKK